MISHPHLRLFEQPATTNQCVLACGDKAEMPPKPKRRTDGWYAAIYCYHCRRTREVVSVIYVKTNT